MSADTRRSPIKRILEAAKQVVRNAELVERDEGFVPDKGYKIVSYYSVHPDVLDELVCAVENLEEVLKMERQEYIANCIERILGAPAHNSQIRQRKLDVATAIMVAADAASGDGALEGEKAAHEYLVKLFNEAENGKYQQPKS